MQNDILYMLGVVAVGWAVTFAFRSAPFVIARALGRDLPPWLSSLSVWISPVVIAGLILYSFSTLSWRTPWPYLAGALTVGLQLWRRNGLVSILAGTALYMVLLANCGCVHDRTLDLDAKHPSIVVTAQGDVYFGGERVRVADVPECLHDAGVPTTSTIPVLLEGEIEKVPEARNLMLVMRLGGYTRSVLVTKRHAESEAVDPSKRRELPPDPTPQPAPRRIRWRGSR